MPTLDAQTLWLLGAGIAGALARLLASESPKRWTPHLVTDAVVGGASSVLLPPILGALPVTSSVVAKLDSLSEQILLVVVIAYIASHVWVNRLAGWLRAAGDRAFRNPPPPPSPPTP